MRRGFDLQHREAKVAMTTNTGEEIHIDER